MIIYTPLTVAIQGAQQMEPAPQTPAQHGAGAAPGIGHPQTLPQQQYYSTMAHHLQQQQSGNPAVFPPSPLANLAYYAQQGIPMQMMVSAGLHAGYPTMMAGGGQMQVRRTQDRAIYSLLSLSTTTLFPCFFFVLLSNILPPPLSWEHGVRGYPASQAMMANLHHTTGCTLIDLLKYMI